MSRVAALAQILQQEGVDAFLAWSPITMGYLANFEEHSIERFLTLAIRSTGETHLICPALTVNQARRAGIQSLDGWKDGENPHALFEALAERWNLQSAIIAVDDEMPARLLLELQSILPAGLFKSGQEMLSRVMRRKEPGELAALRAAAKIADEAYLAILPQIKIGMKEKELQAKLSAEMDSRGGVTEFCIIATGAGGAEPHHLSDDTILAEGDVLIMDFGCRFDGYLSDITRTVAVGSASDEARKVYGVVLDAHNAARAAIHPGQSGAQVDAAARQVIDEAGYGQYFIHRTGHGIGQRGHEEPYIVSTNLEPLEAGNCFSIEPGIYLPGNLGVRIENIVACTVDGHECFNAGPPAEIPIVG
jgi:Xaa-Pro aminopeptidase